MPSEPIAEGVCGNGVIEKGEVCDDHNTSDGDGCNSTCTSIELGYTCPTEGAPCVSNKKDDGVCGNGIIDGLERCDDSNTNGDDGCSADCMTIEPGYECPEEGKPCKTTGSTPDCGNGVLEYGEACDDGNLSNFDGCSNECTLESGYECPDPGQPCTPVIVEECGDWNKTDNEECDDGNTDDGDGCSAGGLPLCQHG